MDFIKWYYRNRKEDWFSLRDLMGGENFYWQGTPLYALYEKQEIIGAEDPIKQADITSTVVNIFNCFDFLFSR